MRDTLAFFKGRVVAFLIAAAGLIVAFLFNHYYLHTKTALQFLGFGALMLAGSYGISFLGAFIINTLRAPWLLDAESGEQINTLERRAQASETSLSEAQNNKREKIRLHNLFGEFLSEGESLADELRRGMQIHGPWLEKRRKWVKKVSEALADMNLPTEAAGFRQAGEKDLPIFPPGTVSSPRLYYDLYSDQLTGYRTKLQEIVHRRLP